MTLIRKPHEIVVQPKIKAIIYGQPGFGKTTLGLSAPKPLLIDCDGGVHRINVAHRTDTLQVSSYNEVLDVMHEDLSEYETIVIDTGGKLLDFMAQYVIARNPKLGKQNGALTLQGYGEVKQEFTAFCKLCTSKNKHLIFVAHRRTLTEGDDIRYVPLFGGSNYDSLVTELDLVGYVEMNGNRRTITFNPSSRNDGKNTCNLPAVMELPVVVDAQGNGLPNTFLADAVIAPYLAYLHRSEELHQQYLDAMGQIKEELEMVNDADTMNLFVANIDKFAHVGSSKAASKTLITAKAKELGLKFNKETKQYEQPAA